MVLGERSPEQVNAALERGTPVALPAPVDPDFTPIRIAERYEPVTDVPLLTAREAVAQLARAELVLGIVVGGEARAYPITMLAVPDHGVINDVVGGTPVVATWCELCSNGIIYERTVRGRTLTFGVSGYLWNRSVVMYDQETDSLWGHMVGEAMQGPMLGAELTMLPAQVSTWADWKTRYPETTVLNLARSPEQYQSNFYQQPNRFSYGWVANRQPFHISIDTLRAAPVQSLTTNGQAVLLTYDPATARILLASRVVEGRALNFRLNSDGKLRDAETGSMWDPATLIAISGELEGTHLTREVGMVSIKEAWEQFYPGSVELGW